MKHLIFAMALLSLASEAYAGDYQAVARVMSAVPNVVNVQVPQQQCSTTVAPAAPAPTAPVGIGGVIGGIAGALLGSQVGQGNGKIAAAAVGAATGALAGQSLQRANAAPPQPVQTCQTVYQNEQQTQGYRVTYLYAGRVFNATLPYDPGQTLHISVQVNPVQ